MQLLSDCSFYRKTGANHVPHYTLLVLPLLVRDCLFVRIYLLISQLTSISRGHSTIRHLWTRVIAVNSATQSALPHNWQMIIVMIVIIIIMMIMTTTTIMMKGPERGGQWVRCPAARFRGWGLENQILESL